MFVDLEKHMLRPFHQYVLHVPRWHDVLTDSLIQTSIKEEKKTKYPGNNANDNYNRTLKVGKTKGDWLATDFRIQGGAW